MKQWYVIHTLPRGEAIACQNLLAQQYHVFLPRYHKVRRHARKTEVVLAPLFPRYLFVEIDVEIDRWLAVESTRGVAYIVRQKGCPTPVPKGIVEELQNSADAKEIVPLSSLALFKEGDRLEVQEGTFAGHTGIYERMMEGERVQLLLNLLGRDLKITLPLEAVAIGT